MSVALADLAPCMEGVIPSLIATSAPDGTPNVSYLSHVAILDANHIALSNQFFSKTALNLRTQPLASVVVVDAGTCKQYVLDVEYILALTGGEQFDRMAARVAAGSARVGLAKVMRLRCVDVFRVTAIRVVATAGTVQQQRRTRPPATLEAVARVVKNLSGQMDSGALVDAVLTGLRCELQMTHTMLLWLDEERGQLTAIGSRGYEATGIGSDVALGEGAIGVAAATGQAVRITDLGRSGRLSAAVARLPGEEDVTRRIALPGLVDALSQIAVPVAVRGEVRGVLFAESVARLAFFEDDEAALMVIAGQAGMVLALIEAMAFDDEAEARPRPEPLGNPVQVVYYDYDHSVFIDGQYVIKGFAGRLLFYMMEQWRSLGRVEFSNREIRLETLLGLPLIKDNLETRLLLLRRRLEEKKFPVRLVRAGRGRVVLQVGGKLELSTVGDGRIDGGPH